VDPFVSVLSRYLLRRTKEIHGKHLPGLELNQDLLQHEVGMLTASVWRRHEARLP